MRTLNVQKTNVIEKGLGQVSLEYLYMRAIKKHFGKVKFDLITYSTPPITFTKVIEWAKRNNPKAVTMFSGNELDSVSDWVDNKMATFNKLLYGAE